MAPRSPFFDHPQADELAAALAGWVRLRWTGEDIWQALITEPWNCRNHYDGCPIARSTAYKYMKWAREEIERREGKIRPRVRIAGYVAAMDYWNKVAAEDHQNGVAKAAPLMREVRENFRLMAELNGDLNAAESTSNFVSPPATMYAALFAGEPTQQLDAATRVQADLAGEEEQ